jgi:hypothetical protein
MIRLGIILTTIVLIVAWDQSFTLTDGELTQARADAEALCLTHRTELPERPFTTDACSIAPNTLGDKEWSQCCILNDFAYWCGGTNEERKAADEELRSCINAESQNMGDVYYWQMRLLGSKWLPSPWRWGYGDSYF